MPNQSPPSHDAPSGDPPEPDHIIPSLEPPQPASAQRRGLLESLNPVAFLFKVAERVPVVRHALAIAGFAAGAFLAVTFLGSPMLAVFGVAIVILLSTSLFLLSKLGRVSTRQLRWLILAFAWFSLLTMAVAISFLLTSFFLNWPLQWRHNIEPVILVYPPLKGAPLSTYESYPIKVRNDGQLYLDRNEFNDMVEELLEAKNPRAAAELVYLGQRENIVQSMSKAEIERYQRLIREYRELGTENIRRHISYIQGDHVLESYRVIVDGIGETFAGTGIEVVLHDVRDPLKSIVAIQNPISGRRQGDPTTNFGLELIKKYGALSARGNSFVGYSLTLSDGRRIKSTTIPLYHRDSLIGFICLNMDLQRVQEQAEVRERFINALQSTRSYADINEVIELAHGR